MDYSGEKETANCWFTTNLEDKILLSKNNPLRLEFDRKKNPRPYVYLFRGMEALILRQVYYEIVKNAVKDENGIHGIWSDNTFFHVEQK